MSRLSLRLWAQTRCTLIIGRCILLEHAGEPNVCLCIDAHGVAAIVFEAGRLPSAEALAEGSPAPQPWPALRLERSADGKSARWQGADGAELDEAAARVACAPSARAPLHEAGRRAIVSAIHNYYQQHVLEPSVAGFLSILEKQFARSDLYLFELLQNAVDEGARHVEVAMLPGGGGGSSGGRGPAAAGLRFSHDGHGFSPLDVNGLASVGMSTKVGKKAVGFMGIGFKACHKRFAHVVCSDAAWAFAFCEKTADRGAAEGPPLPPSAWVLLPRWAARAERPMRGCTFELLEPRGGLAALQRDVRWLPISVPPLLARTALAAMQPASAPVPSQAAGPAQGPAAAASNEALACWTLRWLDETILCTMAPTTAPKTAPTTAPRSGAPPSAALPSGADRAAVASTSSAPDARLGGVRSSACSLLVSRERPGLRPVRQRWQFLSVHFEPDREAWLAYAAHTRREVGGLQGATEEASLFFLAEATSGLPLPVSTSAKPAAAHGMAGGYEEGGSSTLHALLPTKLKLPFAANLQGPWLLSVDRQDVQSLQDSAWNACVGRQLVPLLITALRYLSSTVQTQLEAGGSAAAALLGDGGLAAAYALLPTTIERDTSPPPPPPPNQLKQPQPNQQHQRRQHQQQQLAAGGVSPRAPPPRLSLLGIELDLALVDAALATEALVPVLGLHHTDACKDNGGTGDGTGSSGSAALCDVPTSARELGFVRSGDACLLSAHQLKWLPTSLLRRWLRGKHPLALPLLGPTCGESALWRVLSTPSLGTAGRRELAAAIWADADEEAARWAEAKAEESRAGAVTEAAAVTMAPVSGEARARARENAAVRLAVRLMAAAQEGLEEARRIQKESERTGGQTATPAAAQAAALASSKADSVDEAGMPWLLASDGTLQPASALRWASAELQGFPMSLQRPMLESVGADGTLIVHPALIAALADADAVPTSRQQQQQQHQKHVGRGGGRGQGGAPSSATPPPPAWPSASSMSSLRLANDAHALRKASILLEALHRDVSSSQQLSLTTITRRFFASNPPIDLVVRATYHLMRAHLPHLLTHALATPGHAAADAPPRLLPVQQCSIGEAFGNGGLEQLHKSDGHFVSALYLGAHDDAADALAASARAPPGGRPSHAAPSHGGRADGSQRPRGPGATSAAATPTREQWRDFFVAAGAADGLSFVVSASPLPSTHALPDRRKSAKAVTLPYGLAGQLDHRIALQLEVSLAPSAAKLLQTACEAALVRRGAGDAAEGAGGLIDGGGADGGLPSSTSLASAFAELLGRLSIDSAEQPTAASSPALAAAIRGDAPEEVKASDGRHDGRHALTVTLASHVPCRKRGLYLAAGSPGAAVLDLGVASWVEQLRRSAWVPTVDGRLVTPAEAMLPGAGGAVAETEATAHLHRIALPTETRALLAQPPLGILLNWGTAPPPSPMARLNALAAAVEAKSPRALSEFLAAWRSVGAAAAANDQSLDAQLIRRHAERCAMLPVGRSL